jgi:hypothetical protein
MKTTVEVPDDLYRRAKAEAALRGRKLKDLVEEGLRLVLQAPSKNRRRSSLAGLMKRGRGVIDSGIPEFRISVRIPSISRGSAVVSAIVDTGPLVAFFDRAERHHRWIAQPRRGNRSATPRLRPGAHRSAISARALSEGTGRPVRAPAKWRAQHRVPHRGACRCTAQIAAKVSRLTDVAGRRLRRTYGRDLRPACRPDTRF